MEPNPALSRPVLPVVERGRSGRRRRTPSPKAKHPGQFAELRKLGILAAIGAAVLALVVSCSGCTRLIVRPGPGKTQQDLATDRYDCIKESTHHGWGFNADGYAAGGWAGERVNEDQYYACIAARGHRVLRENKVTGSLSEP